ncbi:MAG: hypothetical protein GY847_17265 [Proteobacteria bacterium]|nr:hypothetical protein [Pseudomonadota bacterium]
MMIQNIRALLFILLLSAIGLAGCGDNASKAALDAGMYEDATDTDTGSDQDANTPEGDASVKDPDHWEWRANPEGGECGLGCEQITFSEHVAEQEWDIWNEYLTYKDGEGAIHVVDIKNKKNLRIPDAHPEYPLEDGMSAAFSPVIYEDTLFYVLSVYGVDPIQREIIRVDINAREQEVIWKREEGGDLRFRVPKSLDVFGSRLISEGGAGNPEEYTLSAFTPPWPSKGEVLIDESYGGFNCIWENIAVFWDKRNDPADVTGYDFDLGEFFPIIQDNKYQYAPRIQGRRVVYMDFRLGQSDPWGNWSKAMVVMYDLDTSTRLRITGGNWIAAYPDIYGDIIVWMDYRNCQVQRKGNLGCVELLGFNAKTKTRFQITDLPGRPKTYPRIWGSTVFAHIFTKDYSEDAIYMFELEKVIESQVNQ